MAGSLTAQPVRETELEVPASIQPLENGDHLSAAEFLRRYEAMPELKKAELIEGIVYMPSPVRLAHAEPDALMHGWLITYAAHTPGTRVASNVTVRLDPDNVPQPDALLRLLPEQGGRSRADDAGYVSGPPELIVEIAASSAAIDLHGKFHAYRRAGVREYLVWRTLEGRLDWFVLEHDEYRPIPPDAKRHLRSPHFPGLVLDLGAVLAGDAAKVLEVLQAALQEPEHAAFVAQLGTGR